LWSSAPHPEADDAIKALGVRNIKREGTQDISPVETLISKNIDRLSLQDLSGLLDIKSKRKFAEELFKLTASAAMIHLSLTDEVIWQARPMIQKLYSAKTLRTGELVYFRKESAIVRTVILEPISEENRILRMLILSDNNHQFLEVAQRELIQSDFDLEREPLQEGFPMNIGDIFEYDLTDPGFKTTTTKRKITVTLYAFVGGMYSFVAHERLHDNTDYLGGHGFTVGKDTAVEMMKSGGIQKVTRMNLKDQSEGIPPASDDKSSSSPVSAVLPRVDPTRTESWRALKQLAANKKYDLRELFNADGDRAKQLRVALDAGFTVDFSKNRIDEETLILLLKLAKDVFLSEAIEQMFTGEKINETENRAVLHTALRNVTRKNGQLVAANGSVYVDGKDVMPGIIAVLNKMEAFTKKVRSGEWKGATGKQIKHVVNVGIGGSDLGPKMAAEALKPFGRDSGITAHFLSNVDGTAAAELIRTLGNPEETLIVIESKTFTTQETIQNAMTLKNWVTNYYKENASISSQDAIKKHFVAVSTAKDLVAAFGIDPENMFVFWDWVGGRYSMWSAIGLTLATFIGFDNFLEMLEGARAADEHFRNQPFDQNIPVLKALLGVWNRNFLNAETYAVLPYDEYLSLLPAFLQQAFMESQGKGTDRNGSFIDGYKTGQILWGAAGTGGQHSFYQLIHQSSSVVPADFIGIARTKNPLPGHHPILYSNFVAQPYALAFGSTLEEVMRALDDGHMDQAELRWLASHQTFPGNKPTTSIFIDEMTPRALGKLISIYENQIMAEGVIYNIFSFDQWGVQLGKVVATRNVLDFLNGTKPMESLNSVLYGNTIKDAVLEFIEKQSKPTASSPVLSDVMAELNKREQAVVKKFVRSMINFGFKQDEIFTVKKKEILSLYSAKTRRQQNSVHHDLQNVKSLLRNPVIIRLGHPKSSSPVTKIPPGGIDLNPALLDLQIKRGSGGVPLPLSMQPMEDMRVDGFLPVIINITPIPNLPMLLGLDLPAREDDPVRLTRPQLSLSLTPDRGRFYAREPEKIFI
jgi:glucose-6-phosphate isomerase